MRELLTMELSKDMSALFDKAFENIVEGKGNSGFAKSIADSPGCTPELLKLAEKIEKA